MKKIIRTLSVIILGFAATNSFAAVNCVENENCAKDQIAKIAKIANDKQINSAAENTEDYKQQLPNKIKAEDDVNIAVIDQHHIAFVYSHKGDDDDKDSSQSNSDTKLHLKFGIIDTTKPITSVKTVEYALGKHPSITMMPNGKIAEVHRALGKDNYDLIYGFIDPDTGEYDSKGKYDVGDNPSIAYFPSKAVLVEIHDNNIGAGRANVWFDVIDPHTGKLENSQLLPPARGKESDGAQYGEKPDIKVYDNLLIEVHRSSESLWLDSDLWLNIFKFEKIGEYGLEKAPLLNKNYDKGFKPSITIMPDGRIFETHNAQKGKGSLWYSVRKLVRTPDASYDTPIVKNSSGEDMKGKYDTAKERAAGAVLPDGTPVVMYHEFVVKTMYLNRLFSVKTKLDS